MKGAIVIFPIRGQGYACAISFPKALVESFRALFSRQDDRTWQDPIWGFKKAYLPAVQAWATQCAEDQQLALHDVTGLSKAMREQILAEIWQQEYEEHIAAMIEVLPKLPPGALTLTHFSTYLVFTLEIFLRKPLFEELEQAAFPVGKLPKINASLPTQASRSGCFYAMSDTRLLHALMPLRIKNFQVLHLPVIQTFEKDVAHFTDQDGKLWFGSPSLGGVGSPYDLYIQNSLGIPYSVTEINGVMYQIAQADLYLERYWRINASFHAIGMRSPSDELVTFIEHFSLTNWVCAYVSELMRSSADVLIPDAHSTHRQLWRSGDLWKHPADVLLSYLERTDQVSFLTLLDWDDVRFQQIHDDLKLMKGQKAEEYYLYCLEHAVEIMQSDLRQRQRVEIQELAGRYGLTLALSTREKMSAKCTDPRMARDVLGLTEELHLRTSGWVSYEDGVIWGKRTAYELDQALHTGYLSDGQHTLSRLAAEGVPTWYVLWNGWPPDGEHARMQWSPHQLIEQAGMDLANCRWFVYPGNQMPYDSQQDETVREYGDG